MINIYGFWISPYGEIHTIFNDFGHKKYMESLLNKNFNDEKDLERELFDEGWIRIVNSAQTFMVNYRCITSSNQLRILKDLDGQLYEDGYNHTNYILDYGYDYHFFDNIDQLIARIKERL